MASSNFYVSHGIATFWKLSLELIHFLQTKYPKDRDLKDMVNFYHNIVEHDEGKQKEGLQNWYDSMMEPLHPSVKYCKAIERFIASDKDKTLTRASVVHALYYHDCDAVTCSTTSKAWAQMDLAAKMKGSKLNDDDKKLVWKFLEDVNHACFDGLQKEVPRVPSRTELAKHIKQKKTEPSESAIARGFHVASDALLAHRKASDSKQTKGDDWKNSWASLSIQVDDVTSSTFSKLVEERNGDRCSAMLSTTFPSIDWNDLDTTDWKLLDQMTSLSVVNNSLSGGMMTQIESVASKLAEDIVTGKKSLNQLNMDSLSNEILSQFDPKDLESMSSSMDALLPAVESLQRQMKFDIQSGSQTK